MCIIIINQNKKAISKEVLKNCFVNNPDGSGYSFTDGKKIYVKKFFEFDKFFSCYIKDRKKNIESIFLLHFRIATAGKINYANCQPLLMKNTKWTLVHNGHFNGMGCDNYSDTYHFAKMLDGNLCKSIENKKLLFNSSFFRLIMEMYLGASKIAILTKAGKVRIFNKKLFLNVEGNLYSNTSYLKKEYKIMNSDYGYVSYKGFNFEDENEREYYDKYIDEKFLKVGI